MQRLMTLTLGVLVAVLAGCEANPYEPRLVNTRIAESISDMAIHNAIVRQQTVYPYHFVVNSPALNGLGQRELRVLAAHYRDHPGTLNIPQNGITPELREARVLTVLDSLARAGVDTDRVSIADGMPGGDGMLSEHVLMIIDGRTSPSRPLYYETGGGAAGAPLGGQ